MFFPRFLRAVPLLLVAACSAEPAPQAADNAVVVRDAEPIAPPAVANAAMDTPAALASPSAEPTGDAAVATTGGDGSQIRLLPLLQEDADQVEGELACSFQAAGGPESILLARANVGKAARGFAVVRNAGVVETLAGTAEGGFGAMEKGATFGGKGLTVRITRQARLDTGNESSAHRALLVAQRGDGAERRIQGLWTCGP